ncbi:hypothetical protein ACSBR1_030624 [Camellia fascicularis]
MIKNMMSIDTTDYAEHGRDIFVVLALSNLSGKVPSGLYNISTIIALSVRINQLEGNIPPDIGSTLPDLKFLYLFGNLFTGTLPTSLSNASELESIDFSENDFSRTMPRGLGKLLGLRYIIFFYQNRLQDDFTFISSLTNCTSLQSIDAGNNLLRGIGNLLNLTLLSMAANNLAGPIPSSIGRLHKLQELLLGGNKFTELPSLLGNLTSLIILNLSKNNIHGSIPPSLGNCHSLLELDLSQNNLNGEIPQSLRMLRGLRVLDLSHNNLSGKMPSYLGELQLDVLNLSFNRLHGEVPIQGVFQNGNAISIVGNNELCGGIAKLDLPPCPSSKSSNNKLSHRMKVILPVVELLKATNGFSEANLIGVGIYASVYKGILDHVQMVIAVKVLNLQARGASKSFMSECKALRAIKHRNLLKILSICSSVDFHGNEFQALVYEFMANGNLGNWLHQVGVGDHEQLEEPRNLKLIQKLDISMDIATALEYLHCGCESTIIHGDLKPSNVLLDDEMTAHIGDFELAKIISTVLGDVTQGQSNSMFTSKKPTANMFKDHLNLHNFVKNALPDRVMEIVDPCILLEHNTRRWINDCMVSILQIGVACSMESPRDRMEMGSILLSSATLFSSTSLNPREREKKTTIGSGGGGSGSGSSEG